MTSAQKIKKSQFGEKLRNTVGRVFISFSGLGRSKRSGGEEDNVNVMSSREAIAAWHRKNVSVHDFYEVIEVIGHGHMGEVSKVKRKAKAWDKATKRKSSSFVPLDDLHDMLAVSLHNKTLSLRSESTDNRLLSVSLHKNYTLLPSSIKTRNASFAPAPDTALVSVSKLNKREQGSSCFLRHYACKTVLTARIERKDLEVFLNEVSIMRKLDHPNIVQLFEVYSTKRKMWLITELCYGGDLFSRKLDEMGVAVVMEQILQAVAHMHSLGVCHGDLKLENVLYESPQTDSAIKLIDFGLSQKFLAGREMNKVCGSIYTVSPEIIECDLQISKGYTEKSDIWSIGCIAFVLLSGGDYPFMREPDDVNDEEKLSNLLQGTYEFGHQWVIRNISNQGKDFIRGTIHRDPDERWSAIEALKFVKERWFSAFEVKSPVISKKMEPIKMPSEVLRGMQSYAQYGPLRKTILMATARTMDKSMLTDLKDLFLSIDHHHTGTLSMANLKEAFLNFFETRDILLDSTMMDIEQIFLAIDTHHSGEVNYSEFLAAVAESQGLITLERLQDTFHRIAKGKGSISKDDLRMILGKEADEETIIKMIEEASRSKDHKINYDDFLCLMLEDSDELTFINK